MTHLSVV
jgi:putative lipase involved disintegration of autophagic bodies